MMLATAGFKLCQTRAVVLAAAAWGWRLPEAKKDCPQRCSCFGNVHPHRQRRVHQRSLATHTLENNVVSEDQCRSLNLMSAVNVALEETLSEDGRCASHVRAHHMISKYMPTQVLRYRS